MDDNSAESYQDEFDSHHDQDLLMLDEGIDALKNIEDLS
jgi:hypothetical protein